MLKTASSETASTPIAPYTMTPKNNFEASHLQLAEISSGLARSAGFPTNADVWTSLGGTTWKIWADTLAGFLLGMRDAGTNVQTHMSITPIAPKLLESLERITKFAELPQDWDGEDADQLTAVAVATACELIERVAFLSERQGLGRVAPATSAPLPDGGLQVEWSGRNARLEVDIAPDGSYGYLVKWGIGSTSRYEESDNASLNTVVGLALSVLSS